MLREVIGEPQALCSLSRFLYSFCLFHVREVSVFRFALHLLMIDWIAGHENLLVFGCGLLMKSAKLPNNHLQEPAEESKPDMDKNMGENRPEKLSMRPKAHIRVESGTCNVCSAPCSSCMHLKLTHMGSKDGEYSDENCHESATSQYFVNEVDVAPFKTRAHGSLHVTSEASNPLSVSSSHDSQSEIADSKANIRSSSVDASLESGILKLSTVGDTMVYQRTSTIKCEDCKTEEGHDDNISCASRANGVSVSFNCPHRNLERKNILHSSPLVNRLGVEGSGNDISSQKSELADTTSDADGGGNSPKVQSKCLPSNKNAEHLEEDSSFDNLGKSVVEHMILPLSKEAAPNIVHRNNNVAADTGAVACRNNESSVNTYNLTTSCVVSPKLELEPTRESEDQKFETLKCSHQVEQDEKSNGSLVLANLQGPPPQSLTGDESEDSENLEQDVKVCDICGDAGREDLLAVCNKCSDGAEHAYCMREMLQEVPKGCWLCEECKLVDENENKKQGPDIEGEKMNKVGIQYSGKRRAENIEISSATKRQAIEMSTGLPKPASPGKMSSLSRDSSFKNLDKSKVKHASASSFGSHSSINISGTAHSSFTGQRHQVPKGTLSKSKSFSTLISKPKVKHVDEVPHIHNSPRESSSDTKEASGRMMSKSISFKSVNSGRSAATDSKVKMLPSNFPHVHDIKRLKQVKERCAFERKNLPKLDRPISSKTSVPKVDQEIALSCESGMVSSPGKNRELKTLQSDGKLGILSRSNSCIARKGLEIPVSSVPSSSTVGMSNASVEQRLHQVCSKEELSSCSWAAERPSNGGNENLQDGSPQSWESSNQDEKATESFVSRLRPSVNAGSKSVTSQACKEIGHAAEFYSMGSSLASGSDAPTARSVREEMNKGSKLKAAIEAAMLKKPGMCRNKKENDQLDVVSSSNVDANCEIASQVKFSGLSKIIEVKHDIQATSQSLSSRQTDINNLKQQSVLSADGVSPPNVDSNFIVPSAGNPSFSAASMLLNTKMLPIPEHEYIWQGAFEVHTAGKFSYLYHGMQAHLSTCASPKVHEVVNKFTQIITLDEVPRISTWPRQFNDCGVGEDNIALYFFAKDIESYRKTYEGLLQNMIQKDLALKGSFDGVELFIYPSTQLPENSQRWNLLFFLWGFFKARRSNCSDSLKKSVDNEISSAVMSSCEKLRLSDKEATACSSSDVARGLNGHYNTYISLSTIPNDTLFALKMDPQTQASGFDAKPLSKIPTGSMPLQTQASGFDAKPLSKIPTDSVPLQTQASGFDAKPLSKIPADSMPLHPEIRCSNPSLGGVNLPGCKRDVKLENFILETGCIGRPNVSKEAQTCRGAFCLGEASSIKIFRDGKKDLGVRRDFGEEGVVAKTYNRDEVKLGRDLNKGDMRMDIEISFEPRKRGYLELSEVTPQNSGSASERMQTNVEGSLIEEGNMCKKLKTGPSGLYVLDVVRDGNSSNDSFALQKFDFGSSSSAVEENCDRAPDEKIILEDLGSTEKHLFPVDSYLGSKSVSLKEKSSNDANHIPEIIPNLELALGGERKSHSKGALSFFVEMMGKDNNQNTKLRDKVMVEEEEDGVSASLSLSLSLPSLTRNKL